MRRVASDQALTERAFQIPLSASLMPPLLDAEGGRAEGSFGASTPIEIG